MKIRYRMCLEDHIELQRLRDKNESELINTKWTFRIFCFLVFQCVIATVMFILISFGIEIPAFKIFLIIDLIYIALVPFFSRDYRRSQVTLHLKGANLKCERTIQIDNANLTYENDEVKIVFSWSNCTSVETLDRFILFRFKAFGPIALPRTAFESDKSANEFIKLASKYQEDATAESDTASRTTLNPNKLRRVALLILIIVVALITYFGVMIRIANKNDPWTKIFGNDHPNALYLETTDGFKSRISQEQWAELVTDWRKKLGKYKKTKSSLRRWHRSSSYTYDQGGYTTKRKGFRRTKTTITGSDGIAYIDSYVHFTKNGWLLNSFEISFKVLKTESYLDPEDVKFAEERKSK